MAIEGSDIFTPIEGDKFAERVSLIEYATVKPSGYLNHRGIYPEVAHEHVVAGIKAYYDGQGRPEPVILFRPVGALGWLVLGEVKVNIPDELPDNFQ
jgi:hypothetical protein